MVARKGYRGPTPPDYPFYSKPDGKPIACMPNQDLANIIPLKNGYHRERMMGGGGSLILISL